MRISFRMVLSSTAHSSPRSTRTLKTAVLAGLAGLSLTIAQSAEPAHWQVPLAGNTYQTASPKASDDRVTRDGSLRWQDDSTVFSIFVRVDRPAALDLVLPLNVPEGESMIRTTASGWSSDTVVSGTDVHDVKLGRVEVKTPGYVRIDLSGIRKTGPVFANTSSLKISSDADGLQLDYVRHNEDNMFYWGRRGPSVHLGYPMPPDTDIEYAYSELTVPDGEDPIGSYFMANGFGEGYFGIQVKSPTERWILFSVWSPFNTDDPNKIPESERIVMLAKGQDVQVGEFGNEGSGGKSYLVFPWKSGTPYRFLNAAQPDGHGNTVYTAWFSEAGKTDWQLIARFKRPKTNKHLTGFHSFLENFHDENGFLGRRARHGNQWVRDTGGKWHELTSARFTGDATASGGHRLDYAGGVSDQEVYLRNGGFFSETVPLNQTFKRPSTPETKPDIDFAKLE